MPLKKTCSRKDLGVNVTELIRAGFPARQATAIARRIQRKVTQRADTATPEPPPYVLDYLRRKGLKPIWHYADAWREEHTVAFTVAGVMERDMLQDMKDTILLAQQKGLPFAQFKKLIDPILADKGWIERKDVEDPITGEKKDVKLGKPQRLKTIFDTNIRQARAAGQWGRIEATKDVLPFLEYRLGPSREHRPEHVVFDRIILPADHPFWRTHYPINGFG